VVLGSRAEESNPYVKKPGALIKALRGPGQPVARELQPRLRAESPVSPTFSG
jgi:hypothetical protein